MTVRYTKLADKRTWAVIGPADEVCRGTVTVTSRNGRRKQLTVLATSGAFKGRYHELAGVSCRFGYLKMLHDDGYDDAVLGHTTGEEDDDNDEEDDDNRERNL